MRGTGTSGTSGFDPLLGDEMAAGTPDLARPRTPADDSSSVIRTLVPGQALAVTGRLAATTVADVRLALSVAVDAGVGDLVLDLSALELLDATGLGVLVGAHRRAAQAGRRLVLRDVPERIDRLLSATRLHRVLVIERAIAV